MTRFQFHLLRRGSGRDLEEITVYTELPVGLAKLAGAGLICNISIHDIKIARV